MTKKNLWVFGAAVCLLVSLVFSPAFAGTAEENEIGKVVYLRGAVKARQAGSQDRHLKLDSPIRENDQIVTFSDSNVEIRFQDGTLYSQAENSTISIDAYLFSDDPGRSNLLFKMGKGTFRMVTGEIVKQNPEAFKLQTPLLTIGIRGTEPFAVVTQAQETIGVLAIDAQHTVQVTSAVNSVSIASAGMMATVSSDGTVSDPTPTPAAVETGVMNAAPMTSLGELGAPSNSSQDAQGKVQAFQSHLNEVKSQITDMNTPYSALHEVSIQENAQANAEAEASSGGASDQGGGDGGGGGGGGGGAH